jgi:hypothetical protein
MHDHDNKNFHWARMKGYSYHAKSQGPFSQGAGNLYMFRRALGFRHHVCGNYRNRPFEIFDCEKKFGKYMHETYWCTVIIIPCSGLDIPNFDLFPRRETKSMETLGVKGLDLTLAPTATWDERQMIDSLNKNYMLFAGGAFETIQASMKIAPQLVPSLTEMTKFFKPSILRFLATATTGFIEVQDGFLAIRATDGRIITPDYTEILLEGSARDRLMEVANDFLDALAHGAIEQPLPSIRLENTFKPHQFFGTMIGIVVGFLVGSIASIILLFTFRNNYVLFLFPILALTGVFLGRYLGNRITRKK